jgi:hypothetical protein
LRDRNVILLALTGFAAFWDMGFRILGQRFDGPRVRPHCC